MELSRLLLMVFAIVVLGTAILHVVLRKDPGATTWVLATAQALIAGAVLIASLPGGSGPSLKRFRMINTSGDQLTNVRVRLIDHGGTTRYEWSLATLDNNKAWEPSDTVLDIQTDSGDSPIVKYLILYTRGAASKQLEIDCPNHSGAQRHDITEVWGALAGTAFHRSVKYREGTWDGSTLALPDNKVETSSTAEAAGP